MPRQLPLPTKGQKNQSFDLTDYLRRYKNIFGIDPEFFMENLELFSKEIIQASKARGMPASSSLTSTLTWMTDGLTKYIDYLQRNNAQPEFITYFKKILEAFKLPLTGTNTIDRNKLSANIVTKIIAGAPVIIPSGYTGHSITFGIYDGKLICINRGRFILNNKEDQLSWASVKHNRTKDHNEEYGLWWTEIDQKLLKDAESLKKLVLHLLNGASFPKQSDKKTSEIEFMQGLEKMLLQKKSSQRGITISVSNTHPVTKQGHRNCPWANKKPAILGLLRFLCAEHPEITEEKVLNEYKQCTTFLRAQEIDHLIADVTNTGNAKLKQLAAKEILLAILTTWVQKLAYSTAADKQILPQHQRYLDLLLETINKLSSTELYYDLYHKLNPTTKETLDILTERHLELDEDISSEQHSSRKSSDIVELEEYAKEKPNYINLLEKAITTAEQTCQTCIELIDTQIQKTPNTLELSNLEELKKRYRHSMQLLKSQKSNFLKEASSTSYSIEQFILKLELMELLLHAFNMPGKRIIFTSDSELAHGTRPTEFQYKEDTDLLRTFNNNNSIVINRIDNYLKYLTQPTPPRKKSRQ